MNPRSTIALVLLAAGLFTYIFFFERPQPGPVAGADSMRKLFPGFDPATVVGVEIFRTNAVIRVERTNGQWRLAQPNYPAQTTAIENWLALLGSLHLRASLSAQEVQTQGGLGVFGLENPQATVSVRHGAGRIQFRVGSRTAVGERLYLQPVGSDGVSVTESALTDRLPQSPNDWRDPTFLALTGVNFDRLYARAGTRDFELERDLTNKVWRLTRPRSARADNGLLRQILEVLQAVRVSEFVSDVPGSDLEPYGLQTPEVLLVLSLGTNRVLTAEFGKNPTNAPALVYARRSGFPNIVAVPRQVADLFRVPYTELLDRRLIEFDAEAVQRIEIAANEVFALDRQTGGVWRVTEPVGFPADPALVSGFLKRLNSMAIAEVSQEVVTDLDLATYGLASPSRRIVLRTIVGPGQTNAPLAQIEFGTNRAGKVFVRRTDENSVYAVKLEDTLDLPAAAFELRDRRLWSFTTNQIASVTITLKNKSWKLLRSGRGQWSFAPGSQGILNPIAVEEAMYRFGQQLRSRAWVALSASAENNGFGFKEAAHKLSVELTNGDRPQVYSLEFGGQSPSGGPFAAAELEAGRTVFELPFDLYQVYLEVVQGLDAATGAPP